MFDDSNDGSRDPVHDRRTDKEAFLYKGNEPGGNHVENVGVLQAAHKGEQGCVKCYGVPLYLGKHMLEIGDIEFERFFQDLYGQNEKHGP